MSRGTWGLWAVTFCAVVWFMVIWGAIKLLG